MSDDDLPFKVVRTNGSDEVVARAVNLLVGRAAYETARRMFQFPAHAQVLLHPPAVDDHAGNAITP